MTIIAPSTHDFDKLCLKHRSALVTLGLKLTKQLSTAEDIVQDTYVRAFMFWPQFEPSTDDIDRDCLVWLRRIMTNTFTNSYRREKRHLEALQEYYEECPPNETETDGFQDRFQEHIAKLKPTHQKLIDAFYVRGLSYEETAEDLGIESTKVQKELWRARQALKGMVTVQ